MYNKEKGNGELSRPKGGKERGAQRKGEEDRGYREKDGRGSPTRPVPAYRLLQLVTGTTVSAGLETREFRFA